MIFFDAIGLFLLAMLLLYALGDIRDAHRNR